jgi:hypothetical protein
MSLIGKAIGKTDDQEGFITVINYYGPFVDLFREICSEDIENLYLATLIELSDGAIMDQIKNYLAEFAHEISSNKIFEDPNEWIKFVNSFPKKVIELKVFKINMTLQSIEIVFEEIKSLVECFVVWYYLQTASPFTFGSILDYNIPDINDVLYPDFNEDQIALGFDSDFDNNSDSDSEI